LWQVSILPQRFDSPNATRASFVKVSYPAASNGNSRWISLLAALRVRVIEYCPEWEVGQRPAIRFPSS
jgi:hypothetical protein